MVVTIVVALVYLVGFFDAGIGILVLLSRYRVPDDQVLTVSLLGAGIILFGLLAVAVAGGVAHGSRLSRMLVTIYLTLHVMTIASEPDWTWWSLATLALEIAVVVVLWTPPATHYFRAAALAAPV
ncbi:hypothetical protein GCM10009739_21460 [Microbacterium ulmi]